MHLLKALRLEQTQDAKPVVALTGAGGKSTLLFRLGQELATLGHQTLLTATTRMAARQLDQAPFSLVTDRPAQLERELPLSLRDHRQVLAMAAQEPGGKLRGLSPQGICRLLALPDVGAAVIEADGSRERSLKAPAGHEPVVPNCATHLLVVAGMAAVGQPLNDAWVHRPRIVADLTGLALGEPLTVQGIARLLAHPCGGLKGKPASARAMLFLNLSLDLERPDQRLDTRLAAARKIARQVLAQGAYESVLIGSAASQEPVHEVHGRVAGIVLAAGGSSRMGAGQAKQLLPWGQDNTLVGWAVDRALAAETLDRVLIVMGHRAEEVEMALGQRPAHRVTNPAWQDGQSTSVRAALQALPAEVSAVIFLLADQPDVEAQIVDRLVSAHRQSLAPIVAPLYQEERWGNPVLFDRSTFAELAALRGDRGGRELVSAYGDRVELVPIQRAQPMGIETMRDYQHRVQLGQWNRADD